MQGSASTTPHLEASLHITSRHVPSCQPSGIIWFQSSHSDLMCICFYDFQHGSKVAMCRFLAYTEKIQSLRLVFTLPPSKHSQEKSRWYTRMPFSVGEAIEKKSYILSGTQFPMQSRGICEARVGISDSGYKY